MSGVGQRWRMVLTAGRTSLWPVPVTSVLLALVAGVLLPRADRALDDGAPGWVSRLLFSGGPDAARGLLDAIASSLMTVTSLTFSLTVVTLQLASSQFSPRLLRTFTRDRFVHATLAVFLATFTYSLTVMRTVRSADEEGVAFVPRFSVTFAFVLMVASVVALVLFLAHLASEIRVETVLETVHGEARATARAVFGDADEDEDEARGAEAVRRSPPEMPPPPGARVVLAPASGFLVSVDGDSLLEAAVSARARVALEPLPGASLVAGTPVGWAWSDAPDRTGGQRLDDERLGDVQRAVDQAVSVGPERTEAQDVAFGLQQLTDVGLKALSPGVNDPTTAVHALGHASALLCELSRRDLGNQGLRGPDDDATRVLLPRPSLADLLDTAVSGPRRYGAADPTVLARIFQLLRELASTAPGAADVVEQHRRRLRATADAQDFDEAEVQALRRLDAQVVDAVAGRWRS